MEHARDIVERTFGAGYDAGLIVQEFIPGNDANMRVLTAYSDRNKKVKLMSLGHVLLEEHTPSGIGNHAVILNDYDAELMAQVKNFLEGVGYTGFSNFDIKYDPRDQEFKFFEVNIRQGRSNYYVTGAGNNLAKYLADDYIYHKDIPLKMAKERALWAAIPIRLALRYFDGSLKEEMKSLIKQGKFTHSVWYNKDRGLVRFVKTLLSQINHIRKYRKYYPVHAHKAAN
jgi:D-aspartate ligase